jgi:transcription initiation factor TFIID subunit 2
MSASISNAKLLDTHEISKELQCTADSRIYAADSRLDAVKDQFSPVINVQDSVDKPGSQLEGVSTSYVDTVKDQFSPVINVHDSVDKAGSQLEGVSTSYVGTQAPESIDGLDSKAKKKKDKKDKKRNRDEKRDKKDDPEYLEKKRIKKEKKKMEKELAKKKKDGDRLSSQQDTIAKPSDSQGTLAATPPAPKQSAEAEVLNKDPAVDTARTPPTKKIKIRFKPLKKVS